MPTSTRVSRKTLSPQCSWTRAEPVRGRRACRGRRVTPRGRAPPRRRCPRPRHGRGDAHRHQFTDLPDLAGGQHRLLGDLEAGQPRDGADRQHAVEVGGGEHAVAVGFRHVDGADAGMGQRAAHEGDVLHPRQAEIADILAAPAHQALVLLAGQRRPDALTVRRRRVIEDEGGHRRPLRPRSPEAGSASRPRNACRRAGRRRGAAGGRRSPACPRCRAAGSGHGRRAARTRRPRSRP